MDVAEILKVYFGVISPKIYQLYILVKVIYSIKIDLKKLTSRFDIWGKVSKNGPSKICGRQPTKRFTWSILDPYANMTNL